MAQNMGSTIELWREMTSEEKHRVRSRIENSGVMK